MQIIGYLIPKGFIWPIRTCLGERPPITTLINEWLCVEDIQILPGFFQVAVRLVEERYKILHNRLGRHLATEDDLIHKAKSKKDVRNYLLKNEVLSKDVQAH